MRLLQKLRTDGRKARAQWDKSIVWYRLRYEDTSGPGRAIELLSRAQAAGRVALLHKPGTDISRLYVGIPEPYALPLQRMAKEFAFSVRLAGAEPEQAMTPMAPTAGLPWDRAFVAHIVDNCAFVGQAEGAGAFLPHPAPGHPRGRWRLPAPAPAGLSQMPFWNGQVTAGAFGNEEQGGSWPLGTGRAQRLWYAAGAVNLYGRQQAVASWLVQLVSAILSDEPAGLIVIDGAGDLVPVLKRKHLVTRHLGRGISYIDVDGAVLAGGINPLAPVPGETEADTTERWQRWFAAMEVHPGSLPLLALARADGVGEITELERWLRRPARQATLPYAKSLAIAVRRLMSDEVVREWLAWPSDCFAGLDKGGLLFSCRRGSWARDQLLHSVTLAAAQLPTARVILHHTSWTGPLPDSLLKGNALISNGPLFSEGTVVLARSDRQAAKTLARRFLNSNPLYEENLQLLQDGEAVAVLDRVVTPVSWCVRHKEEAA